MGLHDQKFKNVSLTGSKAVMPSLSSLHNRLSSVSSLCKETACGPYTYQTQHMSQGMLVSTSAKGERPTLTCCLACATGTWAPGCLLAAAYCFMSSSVTCASTPSYTLDDVNYAATSVTGHNLPQILLRLKGYWTWVLMLMLAFIYAQGHSEAAV